MIQGQLSFLGPEYTTTTTEAPAEQTIIQQVEVETLKLDSKVTLKKAQEWVQAKMRDGVACPCCKQHVKVYQRKLNSAMAYALILIERANRGNNDFIHVESYFKGLAGIPPSLRGDFPKLRHWGLLEQQKSEREDGSYRVGYYRITDAGRLFVQGDLEVSRYVYLFNQECLGLSSELTTIQDALGSKFDYKELMDA